MGISVWCEARARTCTENLRRPAIEPLFRSVAVAYGARVIGVILSGTLDDGISGLQAVKRRGGIAVVQDPDDALFAGMPSSALEHVEVDHCVSLAEMSDLLVRLAAEEFEAHANPVPEDLWLEARMAENLMTTMESEQKLGRPFLLSCPDCGGALWKLDDEIVRFRCHLGHAHTAENLLAGQANAIEHALWATLRALRARASMMERLAERMHDRGQPRIAARFETHRAEAERHGEVIRELLINNGREEDPARADG
jgi:two-component system chemotaxis response regulator CheB